MRRRGIASILLAAIVAGCNLFGQRSFGVSFPIEPGAPATGGVVVLLTDNTGLVTMLDLPAIVGDGPDFEIGATQLPNTTNAVVVTWVGGRCDLRVNMTLNGRQGALSLTVATERAAAVCEDDGINRSVVIRFTVPVDAAQVTVIGT